MENQSQILVEIAFICFIIFFLLSALFIFFFFHTRKMLAKEKRIKEIEFAKQIEVFKAAATAEEGEKERIARNLHDEIIPILNVLRQNLTIQKFATAPSEINEMNFDANVASIDKAIEGLRNTSYNIIPSFLLSFGLEKTIADYINSVSNSNSVNANFINSLSFDIDRCFQKDAQLSIYRLTLEIINNIIKHSKPKTFNLMWSYENNNLIFDFEHDGIGITDAEINLLAQNGRGLGLNSIKARCLILKASVNYFDQAEYPYIRVSIPMII